MSDHNLEQRCFELEQELAEAKELLLMTLEDLFFSKRKKVLDFLNIEDPKRSKKDIEWPTLLR